MSRVAARRFFRHGLLPQLLVFEAVARLGSVTRAAEELHLAQPTVSLQLKKLSETLDVKLFEQRGRRLHLTGAGQALRETCMEILHCLTKAEEKLAPWRQPKQETLQLAAEPEARAVAARLLAGFCSRHPGVQATLHIGERAELLGRLAEGTDDVYLFGLEIPCDWVPRGDRWDHRAAVAGCKVTCATQPTFTPGTNAEVRARRVRAASAEKCAKLPDRRGRPEWSQAARESRAARQGPV
jgi:DNA-binding transcriptional LysR family regulator